MTNLSTALAAALAAIATYKGESLLYRSTHTGSTTALSGWVLHRDRVQRPGFLDEVDAAKISETGTLKGPLSPAMVVGYEIVDGNSNAWAVESVMADQNQICACRRVTTKTLGPNRGQAR